MFPSSTSAKIAGSHKKKLPSLKELRVEYAELLLEKRQHTWNTTKSKTSIASCKPIRQICLVCSVSIMRKLCRKRGISRKKISADRCATEDKIFDKCGLEKPSQQAETGNPPPDGIFCCHFNQEGIACKSYTKFDIPKVCADQNFKPQECSYRLTLFEVKTTI